MNRIRIIAAIALLSVFVPSPSSAACNSSDPSDPLLQSPFGAAQVQTPFSDATPSEQTLDVEIKLKASFGEDVVDIAGLATIGSSGTRDDNGQYALARIVGDDLGIDRDSYTVEDAALSAGDSFSEGFKEGSTGTTILDTSDVKELRLDNRLVTRSGDSDWSLKFDTAALLRTVNQYGFINLNLRVGTSDVPVTNTSSPIGDASCGDNCIAWVQNPHDAAVHVNILEQPNSSDFWTLVGVFAVIALIGSLIVGWVAWLMRRKWFSTLGRGNIAIILCLVFISVVVWATTALVLGLIGQPVNSFVLARDYGLGGYFVSSVSASFLFAIPPMVGALVLAKAGPVVAAQPGYPQQQAYSQVPVAPAPASGQSPIPSWLGEVTPPAQAPQQQWAPPPQDPPPVQPSRPGSDPWSTPQ